MRWSGLTTKTKATVVVVVAGVLWLGGVGSAVGVIGAVAGSPAAVVESTASPSATASPSPTRTVTPSPTPVVTVTEVDEESPIPFDTATVEDPSLAKGQTKLRTAGVNGVLTTTYRITETDGVEIHREKTNETVTTPPVTEVTAVGTYVAPAAADPSPADPPPVAPEQQNQGTITPGAFCADAQSGAVAQAANGRSYQCGGKGPDANGHLHWNTM